MYKIDRRGGGQGGSKNRSLGRTPDIYIFKTLTQQFKAEKYDRK